MLYKVLYRCRSPLLGVCILRTTMYWGFESTVLRGSIESRGIQCIQCASENENETIYTEAFSDNYNQTQKAMQSLKSAGVRRCQSRSTGSSCHPVELIKPLKTTHKKCQPVCFRESEGAKGMNKNYVNCYSDHESELKTTHHEKLLRLIYLTVVHLVLFPT